jgi:uncharacterized protein (DUF433 family)
MDVSTEHIEIVHGAGGPKPRIIGHRIRVKDIVDWYEHSSMSASEIVDEYPQITRADVHAALAYYWDHKDELEAKWAADDAWVQEMIRKEPPSKLRQMLEQRRQVG